MLVSLCLSDTKRKENKTNSELQEFICEPQNFGKVLKWSWPVLHRFEEYIAPPLMPCYGIKKLLLLWYSKQKTELFI